MQITTSYAVDIRNKSIRSLCRKTTDIYRCAVSWLLAPVQILWPILSTVGDTNTQMHIVEEYVHASKNRGLVLCRFDDAFPNMPSYLRRAAIFDAIGAYSSYVSNHQNWVAGGKHGCEPKLGVSRAVCPTFYRDNMYAQDLQEDTASLKLFDGKAWKWFSVSLKHTDMQYLRKHWKRGDKVSAPTLEKHYGLWRLRFACTVKSDIPKIPAIQQKICAVDLGINNDAVCSVMTADGTVSARAFISFADDKGRLYHQLNRVKQFQQRHGSHDVGKLWRYVRNINSQHAYRVANAIADFAMENGCATIVFEHLDSRGKRHGPKKQKLALWRKNGIQSACESIAHRHGIRISRICAWNTSKLAYDGSGITERSIDGNYSVCRFTNGRIYNCDLSASYNIGARYFIRALQKSMDESSWSRIKAEVPDAANRTRCTLSTLWRINAVLA